MYLLDTNHCSGIILGESALVDRLAEIGEQNVAISTITAGELVYMAENSQQITTNLALIDEFLQDIRIYSLTAETGRIYGQLKAKLMNRFGPKNREKRRRTKITGLGVSENDLWIASVAVQHQLTVVSSDRDFLRLQTVEAFSLESWHSS